MSRSYRVCLIAGFIPIICFFLVSCKSGNEEVDPIPAPQNCLLKGQQTGSFLYSITRNDEGFPIRVDYSDNSSTQITSLIEYDDADRIIKMSQDQGYFSYEYDTDGKIISREWAYRRDPSNPYTKLHTLFRYNEQGQIDSALHDGGQSHERYEYDAKGNVIKRYYKKYGESEELANEYLEFDDKKNPAIDCNFETFTIISHGAESQAGLALPWISNHNILSMNVRLVNGSIVNRVYSYQYNELGYPTFCKETGITFSYNCQ